MAGIQTSTGLISGINTSSIIDQLIAIDARPVTLLQVRISTNQIIQQAYADLQTKLSAINNDVSSLLKPSTFLSASGASSNPNVLGVTTKPTATPGTYQFTVARTVATQSAISSGYSSATAALGISGDVTIGLGGGKVTSQTNISDLNGGTGVSRGSFRITDASGASVAVDISSAVTLDDVVQKINSADNIQVKASVGKNGLVLQDTSGGSGTLKVNNVGSTTTATDLGIAGTATGTTLTGSSINTIGRNTSLASLNDGLGVRIAGTTITQTGTAAASGTYDLSIDTGSGPVNISLFGAKTIGDVIDTINKAGTNKFTASLGADGKSLKINDVASGSSSITVASIGNSKAAADLGILGTGTTAVNGTAVRATLGSVLTKDLQGGSGLALGQLDLTDSAGNSATVDLGNASSLSDVIDAINSSGVGLVASVNKAGTGLQITDKAGGSGSADIESSRGATAAQLGIAGTFAANGTVNGANLHLQYVGENTSLADLNGGKGVSAGKFQITNSKGVTATVDTTAAASLGDLIKAINGASGLNVTASIDANGNGLQLTDNSGGSAGGLSVKDLTGTAAANLNIAGTAASGTNYIDGAYSKTVSILATDSLTNIVSKLNQAGAGVGASILNDGSSANPNRLSITASNTGVDGQFTIDTGSTGINLSQLTAAQDAAVFVGSPNSAVPVLVTSHTNTVSNIVNGVSLNLVSASSSPVTVSVTQSSDSAISALTQFVSDVNTLTATVSQETAYSSDPSKKGFLLGDATTQSITDVLFNAINANVPGAGSYSRFAQLGLKIGDSDQVTFDATAFQAAYDKDPNSLQKLFTAFNTVATTVTTNAGGGTSSTTLATAFGTDPQGTTVGTDAATGKAYTKTVQLVGFGLAYQLQQAIAKLNDPVNGTITKESSQLDDQNAQFTSRISDLNALLDSKRTRLETQFANMETVLAGLQTQQTALGSLTSSSSSSSSK